MALTGLQIQKLLPKTNCKECGSNTCMAFAMKLAAKKADLSACPYASDEAKAVLGAAGEPPVRGVRVGPKGSVKLGEETVLYRHEKTFVNQTALAVEVVDTEADERIDTTVAQVKDYVLERVGESLTIEMVAVTQRGGDAKRFAATAERVWKAGGLPLVLRGEPSAVIEAAAAVEGSRSLLCGASPQSADRIVAAATAHGHAVAVTAEGLDELTALTGRLRDEGFNDLVLDFRTFTPAERYQVISIARRAALTDSFKPLGYPHLLHVRAGDLMEQTLDAVTEIAKYGGIVVIPSFDTAQLAALMTLRQNIYTDPQKPIQVEPKVYPIGEPDEHSPVFLTTNFSLTYFIVSGEIENSGTSAWLVVPECEGMSVLTAWAAGKFSGDTVGAFMRESGIEQQVTTREVVIPGYVSQISGELEEALPGWKAVVGPQEAADIESFVKARG
jgi:acetyl-CoA decarbonylase/synthase complex subunit gamma